MKRNEREKDGDGANGKKKSMKKEMKVFPIDINRKFSDKFLPVKF